MTGPKEPKIVLDKPLTADLAFIWLWRFPLRIMGLDLGSKTIGIALSDELGIAAHAMKTISRQSIKKDLAAIGDLVSTYEVHRIVVGLPIQMTGTLGIEAKKVLKFVDEIKRALSVSVTTWDERLTTVQAERVLLEAGLSRKKRKRVIDKTAATLILQSYLDTKQTRASS